MKIGHYGSACDTSGLNKSSVFVKPQMIFPKNAVYFESGDIVSDCLS